MAKKKQGSIVKKGNKYYAVVTVGKKRRWIKGGDTIKDAQQVLSDNLKAVNDGTFRDIKKITFKEFGQEWLKSHVEANIKETCRKSYKSIVSRFTKYFGDALLPAVAHNFADRQKIHFGLV